MHMHSTRFRLFSNTQPATSLLTPSGPPCFGRTLLIRLLSAKSLNITYTRNTNLRSHNVTGGENLIQRAKQLMAPWITQGRIDNWQFTADNHLSSVWAVYGGESRYYLIFSISSQCTKLLGCLMWQFITSFITTIRRLTINKVPLNLTHCDFRLFISSLNVRNLSDGFRKTETGSNGRRVGAWLTKVPALDLNNSYLNVRSN